MKTLLSILAVMTLGTSPAFAATAEDKVVTSLASYGHPFIFNENGITFSVYPDGEFDFYIDDRVAVGANVNFGNTSITFNSGYNYDPYVQYDDYGAVIQVENVPIYYDYYGRVSQIGNVNVWYRNGRVNRIGGMHIYYNPRGVYTHYTGYVNIYNRHYVYRPWHGYFARPAVGFCLVYNRPYRQYYNPVRYSYYRPYHHNYRKAYARVGHHYKPHKAHKRDHIYRNDRRVAVRDHNGRRSDYRDRDDFRDDKRRDYRGDSRRSSVQPERRYSERNQKDYARRDNSRSEARSGRTDKSAVNRRSSSTVNRSVNRNEAPRTTRPASVKRERTVTQRSVTRSPGKKSVAHKSTTVRKPVTSGRTVKSVTRSERSVSSRASAPRKSTGDYRKSSVKRSTIKSPARTSRSGQGVKTRSKSTRVQ